MPSGFPSFTGVRSRPWALVDAHRAWSPNGPRTIPGPRSRRVTPIWRTFSNPGLKTPPSPGRAAGQQVRRGRIKVDYPPATDGDLPGGVSGTRPTISAPGSVGMAARRWVWPRDRPISRRLPGQGQLHGDSGSRVDSRGKVGRDRHIEPYCGRCGEVGLDFGCRERHEQGVGDWLADAVGPAVELPPAADRVERQSSAVGEFGRSAVPDVGVQGASVPVVGADESGFVALGLADRGHAVVRGLRVLRDARFEVRQVLQGPLGRTASGPNVSSSGC